MFSAKNPFAALEKELVVGDHSYNYFDIASFGEKFGTYSGRLFIHHCHQTNNRQDIIF